MSGGDRQSGPPQAVHRTSRWPGWIWAVPIAALAIVSWLAIRDWASSGPTVTVIFPAIADLKPGDTKVHFHTMEVGEVSTVKLEPDLRQMRVTLNMRSDMAGKLGPGTRFWIEGNGFSLSNLSSLSSIISGPSIGVDPKPGPGQKQYQGQAEPPVLQYGSQGRTFILHESSLGSVQRGTPVFFLGQKVGTVEQTKMTHGTGFDVTVFVGEPYDRLVHDGTRFWDAGPVRLSMDDGGPSLQFHSIPALFQGAIAFETPSGPDSGPVSPPGARFTLYPGRGEAENAPDSRSVLYQAVFTDAAKSLSKGAAVTLMGVRIGSVTQASLDYAPADGRLSIDATLALEPSRVRITGGAQGGDASAQLRAMIARLVGDGLQAELGASPPVVGGEQVTLRLVPGQHGSLGDGPEPLIPSAAGGSGVAGIMASASGIAAKLDRMPIDQIAQDLHEAASHIASLTASPELRATLRHADAATASLARVAAQAQRSVPPALDRLRAAVAQAQATLASARDLLSQTGNPDAGPETNALPDTLYEVTRAARSLRELADFLDRHPQALLTGRGASQ